MARPTSYTTQIAQEICDRLEQGETMEDICRDEHMPQSRTVRDWQEGNVDSVPKEVSAAIARARDIGYDAIAARTRQTARGLGDSTQDVSRDKLIIDTDLKLLSKWSKKYADKVHQEITGKDGAPLIPVTKEQRDAAVAAALSADA